jgi:hypothetical protein
MCSTISYSVVRIDAGKVKAIRHERVRFLSGSLRRAEVHWYEAHGVGKRGLKIKRFLD